ncbi:MAG: hypothetical protein ACRECH_03535 [Nitrososphaerales archaeon]
MSSSGSTAVGGAGKSDNTIAKVLLVIVAFLLIFSIYQAFEISSFQDQLSSFQTQNSNLEGQIGDLQNQLGNLESQLQSLSSQYGPETVPSVELSNLCVAQTPSCNDTYVYTMNILNNGNAPIPANYSIFLSFLDIPIGSAFSFSTTINSNGPLRPGQSTLLLGTFWPTQNGTMSIARLNPGDTVRVSVGLGNFLIETNVVVLS